MPDADAVIQTERLILRNWCDDDLQPFADLNADARVVKYLPKALSRNESDEYAARVRAHFDANGFGLWAVEVPGIAPFIGFVGLSIPRFDAHFTPCVEVGWRLAHDHWGNGYATEAAHAAVNYGFTELELNEIVAITVPHNLPSRRVMEKIGMQHNPDEDFDHPVLAAGHPLKRHVLYRLARP